MELQYKPKGPSEEEEEDLFSLFDEETNAVDDDSYVLPQVQTPSDGDLNLQETTAEPTVEESESNYTQWVLFVLAAVALFAGFMKLVKVAQDKALLKRGDFAKVVGDIESRTPIIDNSTDNFNKL